MPLPVALGSALIEGGASVLGGLLGFGSNNSANETNLKIAQMNNEFNERMLDKQLAYNLDQWNREKDYNTEMWERTNEWNSPLAQFNRYKEAGLNPYLAMGQGASGNTVSTSAPSSMGINTPTATPVRVDPFIPDLSGVSQAARDWYVGTLNKASAEADIANTNSDTRSKDIENKYKEQNLIAEIEQKKAATRDSNARAAYQGILNRLELDSYDETLRNKKLQASQTESVIKLNDANRQYQLMNTALVGKQYDWFDKQMRASLALTLSQINLNGASAKAQIASSIKSMAEAKGINISNRIAEQTANDVILTAKHNKNKAYWDAETSHNNSGPRDVRQYNWRYRGSGHIGDIQDFHNALDVVNPLRGLFGL